MTNLIDTIETLRQNEKDGTLGLKKRMLPTIKKSKNIQRQAGRTLNSLNLEHLIKKPLDAVQTMNASLTTDYLALIKSFFINPRDTPSALSIPKRRSNNL